MIIINELDFFIKSVLNSQTAVADKDNEIRAVYRGVGHFAGDDFNAVAVAIVGYDIIAVAVGIEEGVGIAATYHRIITGTASDGICRAGEINNIIAFVTVDRGLVTGGDNGI